MNKWIVSLWISHTNDDKLKYIYTHKAIIIINDIIITSDRKKSGNSAQVKGDHMEEREKKKKEKIESYDGCMCVCRDKAEHNEK
jgi:hypothetical protein